jgi:ubiquinone biosynthesis protein
VQERFEGWTVSDLGDAEPAPSMVDRRAMAEQLLRCTLEQLLQAGFFHADPHPGNVFALAGGGVGMIDFGAVGRLDSIQQAALVDMLAAFGTRDVGLLREGIERVADVTEAGFPEQLERALARLLVDHVRPTGAVDPGVLVDMVTLLSQFGIRLPGDLVLLARALVTLDGTLRALAPEVSLVSAATEMMLSKTEPLIDRETVLREELQAALPRLRRLPDRIDRILTLAGRGDLRIRTVVDEDGRRLVRTLANRALLSGVGTAFLVASVVLLVASDTGPAVGGGTGLFEVFGYAGLLAGSVLLLRVVAAVARDGTT